MLVKSDSSAYGTGDPGPTSGAPSGPIEAYKVAGCGAKWSDYAGTTRSTPPSRTTWSGATTAAGEASVTTSVSDYDFPSGLVVSGSGLTIENFTAPYILDGNTSTSSPNTYKFGEIGDRGGMYTALSPDYAGQDACLKVQNGRMQNCEIFGGVDLIRLRGVAGDLLELDYCWLHDPHKLASSPGQGGGDSHCDIVQMNVYSGYQSSDITIKRSRIDGWLTYRATDDITVTGTQGSYDHATGVLTKGTFWEVIDPSTYSPASGLNQYDSLMTTGLYIAGGAASGNATFDDLYLGCFTYRYISIADGIDTGKAITMSNIVFWAPPDPDWNNLWSNTSKYAVHDIIGSATVTWTNNTDRNGATVASSA